MKIVMALFSSLFALLVSYSAYHERAWAVRKPAADWRTPRVLLIGDSILYGYLSEVQRELRDLAVVDSWTTPLHQGSPGMEKMLEGLVASEPYSVIHINLGLHGWQPGVIRDDDYRPIMKSLIRTIRRAAPQASLIWATTTPTTNPDIEPTTIRRNRIAQEVAREDNGSVDDLYAAMAGHLDLLLKDGVHWTQEGRALQGVVVSKSIAAKLKR